MKKLPLILITMILIIGGCSVDKETLTKEQQDNIAQYAINNYDNIRKIAFVEIAENDKTGFNRVVAVINDSIWVSFQINSKTEEISLNHLASKNSGLFLQNKENPLKNESMKNTLIKYLGESK